VAYHSLYTLFFLVVLHSCTLVFEGDDGDSDWSTGQIMFPANTFSIPDSVQQRFQEDAERLALRDIHRDETDKISLIEIPDPLIKTYYNGLLHLYNAKKIVERDMVIQKYNIHAFPHPEMNNVLVAVDTTAQWVKLWQEGYRFTGNSQIDQLLNQYQLYIYEYHRWKNRHVVELQAKKSINILALAKKFQDIDGVIYAEANSAIGDGDNITAIRKTAYVVYEFSLGYDDCPSGCIHRHYWAFRVRYNGTVEFVDEYGSPLP